MSFCLLYVRPRFCPVTLFVGKIWLIKRKDDIINRNLIFSSLDIELKFLLTRQF